MLATLFENALSITASTASTTMPRYRGIVVINATEIFRDYFIGSAKAKITLDLENARRPTRIKVVL